PDVLSFDESIGVDRAVLGRDERLRLSAREVVQEKSYACRARVVRVGDAILVDPIRQTDHAGWDARDALAPGRDVVRDELLGRVDEPRDEQLAARWGHLPGVCGTRGLAQRANRARIGRQEA